MSDEGDRHIAIVTPSFARDFVLATELNQSIQKFCPASTKHYLIVDRRDLKLFRALEDARTVVVSVEDVIPPGYFKIPRYKGWWFSLPALVPTKGWLVQQLVKLSASQLFGDAFQVNVDSDVRFVRPVSPSLFVHEGRTRLYRKPAGVTAGMPHVKWHRNVCRLLGIQPDTLPLNDYVGNMIGWDSRIVSQARQHVETVTGKPWHVAFAHGRLVSEYFLYGLYVDRVIGADAARVWIDERSWCHTYWGPEPLQPAEVQTFVDAIAPDDVAFSIAGYTSTDDATVRHATKLVLRHVSAA
jgi:hypothetical protein